MQTDMGGTGMEERATPVLPPPPKILKLGPFELDSLSVQPI